MKNYYYFLCFLWGGILHAQDQLTSEKKFFAELAKLKQHNGNILIANQGKTLVDFCSGYADFQHSRLNSPQTQFNLASIAKVMTATAVLQLRDKNKFKLDEPVKKYLKEFPYKDITIRHLLTHTSGLPDLELFEDLVKQFPDTVITNKNVLPELSKWKYGLYFKPGEELRYCNTEYNVLALLIEKTSHINYADYMATYIFKPGGMKTAYVATYPGATGLNDAGLAIPQMRPHPGYDPAFVPTDSISRFRYLTYNNSGTVGQGNIICTTTDLLQFDRAYFSGKLIKQSTIDEALVPVKLNNNAVYFSPQMDTMPGEGKMCYGLGWEIFEQPLFGKSVGHGGFKFGLATFYLHNLDKNQTILGYDNTAGSEFGRLLNSTLLLLNNYPPMEFRTKQSLVTRYGTALVSKGIDHGAVVFNANKADTASYYLNEGEMNNLGYDLFYNSTFAGHRKLALEVFKLATLIFPDSFNTYDSYGQLLRDMGKRAEAILMYKKSIVLNPDNEDGRKILTELLK